MPAAHFLVNPLAGRERVSVKGRPFIPCILIVALAWPLSAAGQTSQGQSPQSSSSSSGGQQSTPGIQGYQVPSQSVFLGGVPSGTATSDVITVTVLDAINRALEHNLGVLVSEQGIGRSSGARWRALSGLLPNINAKVTETREEINLQAFGFGSFGSAFAGIPIVVGPFNVFDARVYLQQSVLDLGTLNRTRSEQHNVEASRHTYQRARDLVVHVAGILYIQALAATARADAARTQKDTAEALYNQAVDLKQNGLIAGIDVLRAEVELATSTQRVTSTANDLEKSKLQLARAIGLPPGQRFQLDDNLPDLPSPDLTLEEAVGRAYRRPDYQAALERIRAAELARRAIVGDNLPSVKVSADYGDIGLSPSDSHSTFTLVGELNVPIFQGGKTKGRLMEADADLRDRRAEADDLKSSIYYEVQSAFLDLRATGELLQVAIKTRDLATQQLGQARDRFGAGVANNLDVVQAQASLAAATEQYISARYGYDLAKGALIRGIGTTEEVFRQILGGSR